MSVFFLNRVPEWAFLTGGKNTLPVSLEAVPDTEHLLPGLAADGAWGIVCCPAVEFASILSQPQWQKENLLFILAGTPGEITPTQEGLECVWDILERATGTDKLLFALRKGVKEVARRRNFHRLNTRLEVRNREMQDLHRIGIALSSQHDLTKLLDLILTESMEITGSDGGSLYLAVDKDRRLTPLDGSEGEKFLMFKFALNFSRETPFTEFIIPIDSNSISGYCAANGKILNLPDVYSLPPDTEFAVNKSFDEKTNYRSKSMLAVPMKNTEGDVVGVIQLINKKDRPLRLLKAAADFAQFVEEFNAEDEALLSSLGSQAAVALENAKLVDDITKLFEGIIMACNTAMEQRDPPTSGHSVRLSQITLRLAEAVNQVKDGPLVKFRFDVRKMMAIRYACLLHDFGKICVPENVLLKPKKLWDYQIENIRQRFALAKCFIKAEEMRQKIDAFRKSDARAEQSWGDLEQANRSLLLGLEDDLQCIMESNEPRLLANESSSHLKEISAKIFRPPEEQAEPVRLLSPFELEQLSIRKGSLNEAERKEMENHVVYTYKFLSLIPWTKHLKQVPMVASSHHEYLNGAGYPRHLAGEQIPIESQMMAIADIFDALTAQDRPYKKAVPLPKALDIISELVKQKQLNPDLWDLFLRDKVYEVVLSQPAPA
jgi:HD-GYP domain-containing protein (c-di-GMP phosphodiesterase class II)